MNLKCLFLGHKIAIVPEFDVKKNPIIGDVKERIEKFIKAIENDESVWCSHCKKNWRDIRK